MRKLLKKLGWSCQKPCVRATQRNEEEIVKWREERWPILKKKALEEGMKIVFVDESGFYLLPFLGKTYAPIGETPIIKNKLSREHLSVISGISAEGGLYKQIWNTSIKGENVVKFLEHLLTHIPGKIMVIWDGASIHRCKAIKEFLSDGAAERIHLERLPGYAPDLNPDEGVWQYLKCVSLKNICFENLDQLKKKLIKAIHRFRARKDLIAGCFAGARIV